MGKSYGLRKGGNIYNRIVELLADTEMTSQQIATALKPDYKFIPTNAVLGQHLRQWGIPCRIETRYGENVIIKPRPIKIWGPWPR